MKAAYIESFNSNLKIGNLSDPVPLDKEVCIAVEYAGVNPVDAKIASGLLKSKLPHEFPLVLGWDVSGRIHSVGKDVTTLNIGDPVYSYCRKPIVQWGCWAEFVTYPEEYVALKPKSLSMKEAAAIPLAGLTAWQALFEKVSLKPDETVLIHAGGGGVGSFAIQLAKYCGATPIITTVSSSKMDYVRSLGADEVINYKSKDFVEEIRQAHPFGIDTVFDTVGKSVYKKSFNLLKPGGRIVSLLEQPDEALQKSFGVEAHYLFVSPNAKELDRIAKIFDKGLAVVPEIQEFNLEQAPLALNDIREGHTKGKIVLKING